jgi:hypothetical protein
VTAFGELLPPKVRAPMTATGFPSIIRQSSRAPSLENARFLRDGFRTLNTASVSSRRSRTLDPDARNSFRAGGLQGLPAILRRKHAHGQQTSQQRGERRRRHF